MSFWRRRPGFQALFAHMAIGPSVLGYIAPKGGSADFVFNPHHDGAKAPRGSIRQRLHLDLGFG